MSPARPLENRIALVAGASSGIGRATAIKLTREGARVALVARQADRLNEVASIIRSESGSAFVQPADLTNDQETAQAIKAVVEHFGGLDILVNAAGILANGTIENTTLAVWDEMMKINLRAVFHLMSLAVPHLIARRGNIVNVSSVTGLRSFPGVLAYCVSKAGVDQLTRCAALELAAQGVRVNAVNPGVVVTEIHRRGGMDEEQYAQFLEHCRTTHPIGRVGEPEEIAELIAYLASDKAAWITGATYGIDGGRGQTCAR